MKLAGDDEGWRAQLAEVCGWFPSTEMLVNHARGLVKVLTDAEKKRAFPYGCGVPPALLLVWAMREATLSDSPVQRARWWMYRSTTMTLRPDPARVASRAEHVDVELALPAPVSPDYQVRHVPKPVLPLGSDIVEDDVDEVLLIPDDPEEGEEDAVQMVAPVAVEGGKTMPIDVELLPLHPDIVKVEEEEVAQDQVAQDPVAQLSNRTAVKKKASPCVVRRSRRLKFLKK